MQLLNLFDLSLIGRADAPALELSGVVYTFGEIESRSNRMANTFLRRGLRPGDRLCVWLANGIEIIDIFLACLKTGVIFVPVNVLYRGREIAHIVRDADPMWFVAAERPEDFDGPYLSAATLAGEASGESDRRPAAVLDGDAPAAIIYTSGTTGSSKGAVLSHGNFASNAVNLVTCWQITSADRFLLPLPLFHVHGLGNGLCCWLTSGCLMRLLERFDHTRAEAELLGFKPTLMFAVPTIYVRLLQIAPGAARQIGAGMRLFVSGSAPLPADVLQQFRELYGHTILERYGMSEALMILSNPLTGERRAGTVGFPLPGVSVRFSGDATEGELLVRSPALFRGYWKRDDATRAAFEGEWFRTGDLAERSPDGYFTLKGRKSDLIISGGFNIYPREIEEFLLELPGVREAAVTGAPDSLRGEVPVAYLVGEFAPEELEERCRQHLASFKVPRRFVRVEAIPRTALGKVQKHLLKNVE